MEDETCLNRAVDEAFFSRLSHGFASERGRSWWSELEDWRYTISGPLNSIVKKGGCEYVYARDDRYFAGVNDPESLRSRLLGWLAELAARVDGFEPASEAEHADLAFMRSCVTAMRSAIEQAIAVERRRRKEAERGN
jgi:hypothetical protein